MCISSEVPCSKNKIANGATSFNDMLEIEIRLTLIQQFTNGY